MRLLYKEVESSVVEFSCSLDKKIERRCLSEDANECAPGARYCAVMANVRVSLST